MAEHPVFFDPQGRRSVFARRLGVALATAVAVSFSLVVAAAMLLTALSLPDVRVSHKPTTYQDPLVVSTRGATAYAPRLKAQLANDVRRAARDAAKKPQAKIVLAFYTPDEGAGIQSLRRHAGSLTHVAAQWLHLAADGKSIDTQRAYDPRLTPTNAEVEEIARKNGIRLLPMLDNQGRDDFDPALSRPLLTDPALQASMAKDLTEFLVQHRYDGLNLDFENLDGPQSRGLVRFAARLRQAFAPYGLSLSADIEVGNDELDAAALAEQCDWIVPML